MVKWFVLAHLVLRERTTGKDLLDRGGGGHKEHAKALLREIHSHHAHENSMSR